MNQYGIISVQTSTLIPNMHPKLTERGKLCMRNNRLPTKTPVELMNNSIVPYKIKSLHTSFHGPGNKLGSVLGIFSPASPPPPLLTKNGAMNGKDQLPVVTDAVVEVEK